MRAGAKTSRVRLLLARGAASLGAWLLPVLGLAQTAAAPVPGGALHSPPAFSAMAPGPVPAPWRLAGLPKQKPPLTEFDIVSLSGKAVLRLQTEASYGNLVFDTPRAAPPPELFLRWSWRLERGIAHSDLNTKNGDDTPLKVCALFDMPLDGLGIAERTRLRLARGVTGEHLPSATLCYVWDRLLPVGGSLPNVFSARVRYVVLTSGPARPGLWVNLERNLAQDFLRAFGHETTAVAPLLALAVGADADNSAGNSLAYVSDISLAP